MITQESDTYNGYRNYPTWNVSLWLNNDEAYYNSLRRCQSVYEVRELATYVCVRALRARALDSERGFVMDLITYALDYAPITQPVPDTVLESANPALEIITSHQDVAYRLLGLALLDVDWEEVYAAAQEE